MVQFSFSLWWMTAYISSYWKYLDDITISEVDPMHGPQSTKQDDFDSISAWMEENCMNLTPKKCKGMRISYCAKDLDVP